MSKQVKKSKTAVIGILAVFVVMSSLPASSQVIRKISGEPGEIFLLPECGAVIVKSDDGPKVEMVFPPEQRPEKYKSIDIQVGDIIKMMNGKSMDSPAVIKETYNTLAINDEVKIGIRRGKEMLMVKFTKANADEMPAKIMVKKLPDGGKGVSDCLLSAGLLLEEKNGKVLIADLFPEPAVEFKKGDPEVGDEIIEIQSVRVSNVKDIEEAYTAVAEGGKVNLGILRGDKKIPVEFAKPQAQNCPAGQPKIIRR